MANERTKQQTFHLLKGFLIAPCWFERGNGKHWHFLGQGCLQQVEDTVLMREASPSVKPLDFQGSFLSPAKS